MQQQVIEIEHAQRSLARGVAAQDLGHGVEVLLAPGKQLRDDLAYRALGVDGPGVDAGQRLLARKPPLAGRMTELVADEVQHVGGVSGVQQAEVGRQPERARIAAHEPVPDGVERATRHLADGGPLAHQRGGAVDHLARRAPREGEQQDPLRVGALVEQRRDPRAERRGLAGSGAGEDQQGAAPVLGGEPLLGVQGVLAEHRSRLGRSTDGCTCVADGRRQTADRRPRVR